MEYQETEARKNIATARDFAEKVLGGGDLTIFDAIVAENVRGNTGLKPDGWIEGKAMYRAIIEALNVAFPDMRVQVSEAFTSADDPKRIVLRFNGGGTHKGAMYGVAATDLYLPIDETHLLRFDDDGKIVENVVGSNNPL
ncbi:MAG: ester cyclase, partial [Fibrella sp.]|nr:ester cyclase [Armatimonadota bacterium]